MSIFFNNSSINDWDFGNSNIVKVYRNGAMVYYKISGESPTPPTPSYKWLATYDGGSTSSAECDASSAITQNEISLTNLVEIEIGSCVTSIGYGAFKGCTSLTSITIGNGVTSIGNFAFNYSHAELTVLPTTPPTISTNYTRPFNRNYLTAIYVPSELVDVYKTDTNWSYYASKIQAIP